MATNINARITRPPIAPPTMAAIGSALETCEGAGEPETGVTMGCNEETCEGVGELEAGVTVGCNEAMVGLSKEDKTRK
jgi:hypothetical protein